MQASARVGDELAFLEDLNQVPGVLGSLLISADGELVAEHLPGWWRGRGGDAAPRLAVVLDALSGGRTIQAFCLRFFEHRLHVLPAATGYLCVLTELWTSAAMLKMAMNVVARRLS